MNSDHKSQVKVQGRSLKGSECPRRGDGFTRINGLVMQKRSFYSNVILIFSKFILTSSTVNGIEAEVNLNIFELNWQITVWPLSHDPRWIWVLPIHNLAIF